MGCEEEVGSEVATEERSQAKDDGQSSLVECVTQIEHYANVEPRRGARPGVQRRDSCRCVAYCF